MTRLRALLALFRRRYTPPGLPWRSWTAYWTVANHIAPATPGGPRLKR